uniref:Uncharacterized protein n=1 Tax=Zea mays TaxID=4577 RepID=A0A804PWG8_MAIZE
MHAMPCAISVRPGRGHVHPDEPEPGLAWHGGGVADDAVALLRVPGGGHVLPAEQQRVPPAVVPLAPAEPAADPPRLHGHRGHDRGLLLPAHLLHLPVRAALAGGVPVGDHGGRGGHGVRAHVAPPERAALPRPPRAAVRRHGPVRGGPRGARGRRQLARAAPQRHAGVRGRHGRVLPGRHRVLPRPGARALAPRRLRPRRPQPPDLPRARHRRRARALRRRHRVPQGSRRDGLPGQLGAQTVRARRPDACPRRHYICGCPSSDRYDMMIGKEETKPYFFLFTPFPYSSSSKCARFIVNDRELIGVSHRFLVNLYIDEAHRVMID